MKSGPSWGLEGCWRNGWLLPQGCGGLVANSPLAPILRIIFSSIQPHRAGVYSRIPGRQLDDRELGLG